MLVCYKKYENDKNKIISELCTPEKAVMIKKYTPLFCSRKQVIKEGYLRLFPDKTTPIPSPVLPQDPHGLCAQNPDGLFLFCFFSFELFCVN